MPFCKATLLAEKPRLAAYPKELKTLGDHLKKKRLDLKMTQKEVAAKLQTTVCTYRNWEKNRSKPVIKCIPRIIEFLGYFPFAMEFENLGQKILAYRQLLGLWQKDLAKLLGVDPTTIKRWENNQSRPQQVLMQRMSALLSSSDLRIYAK